MAGTEQVLMYCTEQVTEAVKEGPTMSRNYGKL